MNYGLYLAAGGLMTNLHKQDVTANNLANVNTTGFKRSLAEFQHRAPETAEDGLRSDLSLKLLDQLGGGVFVAPSRLDASGGAVSITDNPLDVGIEGPGYFAVRDGQQTRLTRDGRLTIHQGVLATSVGLRPVLDMSGQPIPVDNHKPVTINENGDVRQDAERVGRIRLVGVPDNNLLKPMGSGLYEAPDAWLNAAPANGANRLIQGALEQSNVDPVREMLAMIESSRAVNFTTQLIRGHDQTMDRAVNVLGRVT
jgi:flagellar basal body rod protein FlgG